MATGELLTHVLRGDMEAVHKLFEEKGDLVRLDADDVDYEEDGEEK